MDNNSVDKKPGMEAAEETVILDAIENYIAASTTYTTVDMEITGVDVDNTGVRVEITWLDIDTPLLQDSYH